MEGIVEQDMTITLKGLTVQEAQHLKDGLRTLKQHDRWLLGERRTVNIEMTNEIDRVQTEWARKQ